MVLFAVANCVCITGIVTLCGCDAGGSTHSLPTSLALERPPSILLSRGALQNILWVMSPFPVSPLFAAQTVSFASPYYQHPRVCNQMRSRSRAASNNQTKADRISILPQWQTVSFADVKERVGIPTNNAAIVPLNIPFCQPLNIPPYWQGGARCAPACWQWHSKTGWSNI